LRKEVIIIGGGIAGLAAASTLRDCRITVLEAQKRFGGRIHTLTAASGAHVELGAEFVHGESPALLEAIRAAGLSTQAVSERNRLFDSGHLEDVEMWEQFGRIAESIDAHEADEPFAQFIKSQRLDEKTERLMLAFAEGFNAAHADRLSAHAIRRASYAAEQMDVESQKRVPSGYSELVNYLLRQTREAGATLHNETEVRAIRWREGRVEIEADWRGQAEAFVGDAAIITLPLGVLKAGMVAFEPALPDKTEAIAGLEFGHVVKVTFSFHRPWWPERDFGFIHALRELLPTWWSYPEAPMITGWAGGPKADALLGHSPAELEMLGLDILARIFSKTIAAIRAELVACHSYNWAQDPYARGAYSYIPVGGLYLPKQLGAPIEDTLFFAGEATARDAQMGTVFGAFESGLRAASEVMGDRVHAMADASARR
jgi:monoamine oxidase